MADDVDDLLRRAMTTLDRETPAEYFDELPGRTLARLDGDGAGAADPGDDLARERAARIPRATPGSSSQPSQAAPADARARARRWPVVILLAGTGLAAVFAVMLFSATRMRAGAPEPSALGSPAPSDEAPQKPRVRAQDVAQRGPSDRLTIEREPGRAPEIGTAEHDRQGLGASAPSPAARELQAGMQAVAPVARRCFPPGPRGSAALEITVFPSGEVSEVKVAPPYAGTPAEDCVTRAVKSHRFSAWDGAPQTFHYRLPTSALRSRAGDVAPDGTFLK